VDEPAELDPASELDSEFESSDDSGVSLVVSVVSLAVVLLSEHEVVSLALVLLPEQEVLSLAFVLLSEVEFVELLREELPAVELELLALSSLTII